MSGYIDLVYEVQSVVMTRVRRMGLAYTASRIAHHDHLLIPECFGASVEFRVQYTTRMRFVPSFDA